LVDYPFPSGEGAEKFLITPGLKEREQGEVFI